MPRHWPQQVCRLSNYSARGHFHASFTMVDVVITAVSGRATMAEALGRFAGLPQGTGRVN